MDKVTIVGLGYVGFPLLCEIAKTGKFYPCGFDVDQSKIEKIRQRIIPINDPSMNRYDLGSIRVSVSYDSYILDDSDIIVICVPTPVHKSFLPNFKPLKSAAELLVPHIKKDQLVIIESTVNPGVTEDVIVPILEQSNLKAGKDFDIAYCPERINPGDSKWNLTNIPRNVGSLTERGAKKAKEFYSSFIKADVNIVSCLKVAEASKIIENTFRDINIAYVNELAKSFDQMGIDLYESIKAASNKPFAYMAHYPSCGVGGHCIPVDPYYLIQKAKMSGFDHRFLRIAREVNNSMPEYTVKLLSDNLNKLKKPINGTKIGIMGLSYKKNVGDLRQSPCLEIIKLLENLGAVLFVFDPYVRDLSNVYSTESLLANSEALILATDHDEFVNLPVQRYIDNNIKLIIDGKNALDMKAIKQAGILYKGIGR